MTVPLEPTRSEHAPKGEDGELVVMPDPSPDREPRPDRIRGENDATAVQAVRQICPYLIATSGSWRSASPNREHRCGAVDPPGLLTIEKQRRLCLSVDHGACAAFRAAKAGRASVLAPGLDPTTVAVADAARRPIARTAAVVLERPRFTVPTTRWPLDRALTQVVLVGLMILAFGAVAISRLSDPGAGGVVASPPASPSASPTQTPRPTLRPTPSPSGSPASPGASAGASPVASPPSSSAAPSFRATYRVKSGDTLVAIAAQFGTTVRAIQDANGLTGSDLKVGQVLNIP
jgi:LysM repeat protein